MARSFVVSRRKAAILLASTLASSLAPVAASQATPASVHTGDASVELMHRQISDLMLRVRRASGTPARARAFARCADAIRGLGTADGPLLVSSAVRSGGTTALYRATNATLVLATVIVRELESWPMNDASWLMRFSDLERAFATHVNDYAA